MDSLFPRTTVGGVSLPRMLMGTNWMLGWSHRSAAADSGIRDKFQRPEDFYPIISAFLDNGIDAIMAPASTTPIAIEAIRYAEQKYGKKIILIDTPGINVDDSAEGRASARETIRQSKEAGADFCLLHHSSVEQLINKNKQTIDRLPDYLYMIREEGMHPGLGAHMPEVIIYSDANDYDVETYIQIFNCMGFLMQIEVEGVYNIIKNAKHPVMTIKPFAAGRCTPFVGLNFNWNVLRDCDMITAGVSSAAEALEDIEISRAVFERRHPELEGRSSPFKQSVLGN